MILLKLFWEFLKIGLFSIGGGMATIPFLYELSDKTGWFTHTQIADMLAVSESTPGPVGINMATYVGYNVANVPGALLATLGIITPGIILALLIATMMIKFKESKLVTGALYGIRPASVGLIAAAGILVARITFINPIPSDGIPLAGMFPGINIKAIIWAALLLLLTRGIPQTKNLHPVVFIFFSAIVGVIFDFA